MAATIRILVKDMDQQIVSPSSGPSSLEPNSCTKCSTHSSVAHPSNLFPRFTECASEMPLISLASTISDPGAGYHEQRVLFVYLRATSSKELIVVGSDDLLQDPTTVLRAYCQAVGVEFKKEMIHWNPGSKSECSSWPGFHVDVENSAGIGNLNVERRIGLEDNLPQDVRHYINKNLADYEHLKRRLESRNAQHVSYVERRQNDDVEAESQTGAQYHLNISEQESCTE